MKLRRTMMFVPGNRPGLLNDLTLYKADVLIFDLEDSVTLKEKDAARHLLQGALKKTNFGSAEIMVRVNDIEGPYGKSDIEAVVAAGAQIIRMPKADTAKQVGLYDEFITKVEEKYGLPLKSVKLLAALESALGVINAYSIAGASERLIGLALGAEDFTADLGVSRSAEGEELLLARQSIVLAAKANGLEAYDTVYSQINNMEGLRAEAERAKALGFSGKSVLHPAQIEIVHEVFAPGEEEIANALRLITALKEAEARGSGVLAVDGAMVDRPVILRAERVLAMAKLMGKID